MSTDFEQKLQKYAQVIVKVGLNLQPGQCLLVGAPAMWLADIPIQAAPLVRQIAAEVYKAGARLVDVIWGDDQLKVTRLQHAPPDSLAEYPTWQVDVALTYVRGGDAVLFVLTEDPDLLSRHDPDAVE